MLLLEFRFFGLKVFVRPSAARMLQMLKDEREHHEERAQKALAALHKHTAKAEICREDIAKLENWQGGLFDVPERT